MNWMLLVCLMSIDPTCSLPIKVEYVDVLECMKGASQAAYKAAENNIISASLCYPITKEL